MSYPVSIKGVLLIGEQVALMKNHRDEWELPGGRIEPGESPEQTVAREFEEELGVRIAVSAPIDSYLFEVIPAQHVFIVTYGCRLIGEFEPRVSDEHTGFALHPVDDLHTISLPAGYRASILRWLEHPSIAAAPSARPPSAHR